MSNTVGQRLGEWAAALRPSDVPPGACVASERAGRWLARLDAMDVMDAMPAVRSLFAD